MKLAESPVISPKSNRYSNPNDRFYHDQQPFNAINQRPNIKKTFSELNSRHDDRSSVNSENLYTKSTKIPKVILDEIGAKTREQNRNRMRDQKKKQHKIGRISKRQPSLEQSMKKSSNLFDEEQNEAIQEKPQPTGSIRKSLTSNKFNKIHSMLSSRNSPCPICLVEGNNKEFISIAGNECSHMYCRSCMHQYVIFQIKMFEKVTCPDEGCEVSMKISSQIYAQLPLDTREKFRKILQYNEVIDTKTKRICPNQKCEGLLDISNPSLNPRCPQCRIVYCKRCFFQNHAGECASHQLQFFCQTLNYRQCARCQNMIQKNQGCNHMTCRCGYQFCYLCGQKWKSSHNCVNIGGEPYVRDTWELCCCECTECDACDSIDYCCECMCFDEWEVCEIRPIRYLAKFLIVLLLLVMGMPLWINYMVISTVIRLLMGVFMGLFILPCAAFFSEHNNYLWIILAVIFLPISIPVLIVMGIKTFFEDNIEDLRDEFFLPCEVLNEIFQL